MSNYLFSDFFQGIQNLDAPATPIVFTFQESGLTFTSSELKELKLKWDKASKSYYLKKNNSLVSWDFELPTFSSYTLTQGGKELCYWGGGHKVIVHSKTTCDCFED